MRLVPCWQLRRGQADARRLVECLGEMQLQPVLRSGGCGMLGLDIESRSQYQQGHVFGIAAS